MSDSEDITIETKIGVHPVRLVIWFDIFPGVNWRWSLWSGYWAVEIGYGFETRAKALADAKAKLGAKYAAVLL